MVKEIKKNGLMTPKLISADNKGRQVIIKCTYLGVPERRGPLACGSVVSQKRSKKTTW